MASRRTHSPNVEPLRGVASSRLGGIKCRLQLRDDACVHLIDHVAGRVLVLGHVDDLSVGEREADGVRHGDGITAMEQRQRDAQLRERHTLIDATRGDGWRRVAAALRVGAGSGHSPI